MNRAFAAVFVLLAMLVPCMAQGAGPPIVVTHTLTGYSKGADAVMLEYSLHVVNRADVPLSDLTLAFVPLPPFGTERTTVTVGHLGPRESVDLTLQLVAPTILDQDYFSRNLLLWTGKCADEEGAIVQFPIKSRPGDDNSSIRQARMFHFCRLHGSN